MFNYRICVLACLSAVSLVGCGGGDNNSAATSDMTAQYLPLRAASVRPASDYHTVVQQLYVAYFGRPADAGGLANFAAALANIGVEPSMQAVTAGYAVNQNLKSLVDGFGNSAESNALYGAGDTTNFVNSIYVNVLNRTPDGGGLAFWKGAIDSGALSKPNAAISIMAGALSNTSPQGVLDAALINKRIAVASAFTTSVSTSTGASIYNGNVAAAAARTMLSGVKECTDISSYADIVSSTVRVISGTSTQISTGTCTSSTDGGGATTSVQRYLGTEYAARNKLTITLQSWSATDLGNGYIRYSATYNQTNNTTTAIDEGSLILYFTNAKPERQAGWFSRILPGASFSTQRSYTFDVLKTSTPLVLQYDHDHFFEATPVTGALQWKLPIPAQ